MAGDKEPAGLKVRQTAAARLREVLTGSAFRPFSTAEIADGRDRALANRLVTTALRRNGHLDVILGELLERGLPPKSGSFEAVLRLALAQLVYLPEIGAHSAPFLAVEAVKRDRKAQHLAGLMNAVLRRAQANSARYWTLSERLLIPETLRDAWIASYGEWAVDRFAAALLEDPPLDLTLKDADPELVAALGAEPVLFDTVRVNTREKPVDALPGFAEGRWWVQDLASSLPARLLNLPAGAKVLDLCAAPGGKTAQLVKAGYDVTAVDNDKERIVRLRENLERLGFAPKIVSADAVRWRPDAPADGILLDAPCSATGTFRRHPEVLLRPADVADRVALQRALLKHAASCLAPGGMLLYCVCSLELPEGEMQAEWAQRTLPLEPSPIAPGELAGFEQAVTPDGQVRTHPGLVAPGAAGGTLDGFFVARFTRR